MVVLMLWHGIRAPAVAGVGRQPVSIGTLPTRVPAAQPGPPAGWPTPCARLSAVTAHPRRRRPRPCASSGPCRTPDGATALARAAELLADRVDVLLGARPAARRGRHRSGRPGLGASRGCGNEPGRCSGPTPTVLLFTADTLEQAGRPPARRPPRRPAAGRRRRGPSPTWAARRAPTRSRWPARRRRGRRRPRPGRPGADRR